MYCIILGIHTDTHPLRFRCFLVKLKKQFVRERAEFLKRNLAVVLWAGWTGWKYTGPRRESFMRNKMWWWLREVKNASGWAWHSKHISSLFQTAHFGGASTAGKMLQVKCTPDSGTSKLLSKTLAAQGNSARWEGTLNASRVLLTTRRSGYITVLNLGHGNLDR